MNILTSNSNTLDLNKNLITFKDCPNNCVDGYIFDPYNHKRSICPYCAEKRESFAKNGLKDKDSGKSLSEILDLPESLTGYEYNEDIVIPMFVRKHLEDDSVTEVLSELNTLMTNMAIGLLPKYSIMFNLGSKANEINFIYPYLIKGYMAGRTLLPLVNAIDICQLRLAYEGSSNSIDIEKSYNYKDLLERDLCLVVIDAGATRTSISAVKGLMQLRAQRLRPTIIFTNYWGWDLAVICSEDDSYSYNFAKLISVKYKDKQKTATDTGVSPTIQSRGLGMSSDALRNLMTPKNSL